VREWTFWGRDRIEGPRGRLKGNDCLGEGEKGLRKAERSGREGHSRRKG